MGDSGSGLLGYCFGVLAVASEGRGPGLLVWALLLGAFGFDATVTLLRRAARGERWYQAHRLHAYQRLAARLGGHMPVTAAFGAVNLILGALATVAVLRPPWLPATLLAGAALLAVAYVWTDRVAPWPAPPE